MIRPTGDEDSAQLNGVFFLEPAEARELADQLAMAADRIEESDSDE